MKTLPILMIAGALAAASCDKKPAQTPDNEEPAAEKSASQPSPAAPVSKPDPAQTDQTNPPGGFRTPAQIALRELPFEPCRQTHRAQGSDQLIRTFEYTYEDGKLLKKLDLTADGVVRAAWSYDYDEQGQRLRMMRDDAPEGREMVQPDLIVTYAWKDGAIVNSAWAFAKEPDKVYRNRFKYAEGGQLVEIASDGFPADPPRDDHEARTWTLRYDDKGYLMRRDRAPDADGIPSRQTAFGYRHGRMISQVHTADIEGATATQFDASYEYDEDGKLIRQVLEWGYENYGTEVITYDYDCD